MAMSSKEVALVMAMGSTLVQGVGVNRQQHYQGFSHAAIKLQTCTLVIGKHCWQSIARMSFCTHFTFFFRSLSELSLTGTIPAVISTLVDLTSLCVRTSF